MACEQGYNVNNQLEWLANRSSSDTNLIISIWINEFHIQIDFFLSVRLMNKPTTPSVLMALNFICICLQ